VWRRRRKRGRKGGRKVDTEILSSVCSRDYKDLFCGALTLQNVALQERTH
jgi:hypothetical protein